MSNYLLKTESKGLKVLFVPSKDVLSFQVTILVGTGSDWEKPKENGLSHFLEHMCFKGTKKRPKNILITQELDNIGALYNAFTSREITGYFIRCSKENYLKALDIVADIYLNSLFNEEEIEKEKKVIIEEINMYQDDPQSYIWDLWDYLLYQNQPAGRPVAGTPETVLKFKRRDLINYRNKYYHRNNTLIIISGNFNQKINQEIFDFFQNLEPKKKINRPKTKEPEKQPVILLKHKDTDQAHLIIGFKTFDLFDKRNYPLDVLNTILSGGMSAFLFQVLREKLSAAYYCSSDNISYTDRGYLAITMGLDLKRIDKILKTFFEELFSLQDKIDEEMVKKAKNYLNGVVALRTENIHNLALKYGEMFMLRQEIIPPKKYLEKINQVDLKEVKNLFEKLITPERTRMAIIGPFKKEEKFVKILKESSM